MKILKKIFYGIAILIVALCAAILLCAVNPGLSQKVSNVLYGDGTKPGRIKTEGSAQAGDANGGNFITKLLANLFGNNVIGIGNGETGSGEGGNTNLIVTLPDEVGGLSGYQPVSGLEEEVSDEVAKSIQAALSAGDTGESLEFDTEIYPYFGMLTSAEQSIYKQIYANAVMLNTSFAPVVNVTNAQLKYIFEAVVNDHPELFYLDTSYTAKYTGDGNVVEIKLAYYTLVNDITSARAKFEANADAIVAGALELPDSYSREKYVHDVLITNVAYDTSAQYNQSAYSALVNGKTVCAGYARANQYILQRLGIPCYYCTGYSGADHAWNIVKLGDGYYNEDVTWDDTNPSTYNYFNKSDKAFADTHVRTGMSLNLPKCNANDYSGLETGEVEEIIPEEPEEPLPTDHITPMTYEEYLAGLIPVGTTNDDPEKVALQRELAALGLTESNVLWTVEDYYADCKKQLIECGSGDQHFSVIVPAAVFSKLESEYAEKKYEEGYVNGALNALGMNRFNLQIQAEKLGDGKYYKLYHNIVTWKE